MSEIPPQIAEGVRLFNSGEWLECHEALESVWLNAGGVEKERLHALILSAVSLLHLDNGNLKGARSVGRRALAKLASLPEAAMGIDISGFRGNFEKYLNAAGKQMPAPKIEWVKL